MGQSVSGLFKNENVQCCHTDRGEEQHGPVPAPRSGPGRCSVPRNPAVTPHWAPRPLGQHGGLIAWELLVFGGFVFHFCQLVGGLWDNFSCPK